MYENSPLKITSAPSTCISVSDYTNQKIRFKRSWKTSSFSSNIPPATSTKRLLSFFIRSRVVVDWRVASKFVLRNSLAQSERASQRVCFLSGKTVYKLLLRTTAARDFISKGASGSMMTVVRQTPYLSGSPSLILPSSASATLRASLSWPKTICN